MAVLAAPPMVNRPLAAAGLMLLAVSVIGFTDNYVRVLAGEAGLWQFHLVRTLIACPLLALVARAAGMRLRPRAWRPVLARSALHAAAMVIYFACLAVLPVAIVAAALFTAPVFVLLIGWLFLGERLDAVRVGAVVAGFAGVLLMLGPGTEAPSALVALPVAAAVLYALGNIATRRWCAGESAATLTMGFFAALGLVGAVGAAALTLWPLEAPPGPAGFALRGWVPFPEGFLVWIVVQAVGALVGVALIVRAYQLAEAGTVAVFEYALLVTAAIWGWLLWGEVLGPAAWAGIALITAAGATLALRGREGS